MNKQDWLNVCSCSRCGEVVETLEAIFKAAENFANDEVNVVMTELELRLTNGG